MPGQVNLTSGISRSYACSILRTWMRFVGLDTYEAAGGGIRRDLFADEDAGVYLTDAALALENQA